MKSSEILYEKWALELFIWYFAAKQCSQTFYKFIFKHAPVIEHKLSGDKISGKRHLQQEDFELNGFRIGSLERGELYGRGSWRKI